MVTLFKNVHYLASWMKLGLKMKGIYSPWLTSMAAASSSISSPLLVSSLFSPLFSASRRTTLSSSSVVLCPLLDSSSESCVCLLFDCKKVFVEYWQNIKQILFLLCMDHSKNSMCINFRIFLLYVEYSRNILEFSPKFLYSKFSCCVWVTVRKFWVQTFLDIFEYFGHVRVMVSLFKNVPFSSPSNIFITIWCRKIVEISIY